MADLKKLAELINRLNALSLENKIPWKETSNEQAFQATFQKYTVTVTKVEDSDDSSTSIRIVLRDGDGRILEEAWQAEFNTLYNAQKKSVSSVLRQLHENARRKALNVDSALDDLLGSLEDTQN